MSIKIGNQIVAKSSTYHPDLFDVKWSDHILNNMSWLRADTFSWQSGEIYQRAYQHLYSDFTEQTSIVYYSWEYTDGTTSDWIYTTTLNPAEGDQVYTITSQAVTPAFIIDSTMEATPLYIRTGPAINQTYNRNSSNDWVYYPDLKTETIAGVTITYFKAADGHKLVKADQEQNVIEIYNKTGIAWYYIIDTSNKQFKLPRTQFAFAGIRDLVGKYISPGLPNITGSVGQSYQTTGINGGWHNYNNCGGGGKGALYLTGTGNGSSCTWSGYGDAGLIAFNASRSNSIYGASTTVQPAATQMYLYIYVGEYTQAAVENTAGLNAELFNHKADLDYVNTQLATKAVKGHEVIAYQAPSSSNAYLWYRKYADGWVEQGQSNVSINECSTVTKTLPIRMSNTYYTALAQNNTASTASDAENGVGIERNSVTQIRLFTHYTNPNTINVSWMVCGIAA